MISNGTQVRRKRFSVELEFLLCIDKKERNKGENYLRLSRGFNPSLGSWVSPPRSWVSPLGSWVHHLGSWVCYLSSWVLLLGFAAGFVDCQLSSPFIGFAGCPSCDFCFDPHLCLCLCLCFCCLFGCGRFLFYFIF